LSTICTSVCSDCADHRGAGAQFGAVAGGQRVLFQAVPVFQQQQPVLVDQFGQDFGGRIARIVLGKGDEQRVQLDRLLLHLAGGKGRASSTQSARP
jgi:hypothetical protein